MEYGGRWRYGNKHELRRVAVDTEPSMSDDGRDQEDLTTTTTTSAPAPVSMAHLEQYTDAAWVEPSDELSGTAVFDATGDAATMPSWDELVRQHADRVYRLAYRLSGNQHDAEDLTQETFIRVFRSVQNYQPGTFEGWLHRITTNLFLDMVRRRGRIRMEALPEDYDRVPAEPRADLPRLAARPRSAGRAGLATAGIPRRGRPVRHRGPVL
jgi:RNA polymerase sigma-70 factor (ECF subfamily)